MQALVLVNSNGSLLPCLSVQIGKPIISKPLGEIMSNKDKKRQQRLEYHRDFKTGGKATRKKHEKSPAGR